MSRLMMLSVLTDSGSISDSLWLKHFPCDLLSPGGLEGGGGRRWGNSNRVSPSQFPLTPISKILPIPCELQHAFPGISPNKASFCSPLPRSGTHAIRGVSRGDFLTLGQRGIRVSWMRLPLGKLGIVRGNNGHWSLGSLRLHPLGRPTGPGQSPAGQDEAGEG